MVSLAIKGSSMKGVKVGARGIQGSNSLYCIKSFLLPGLSCSSEAVLSMYAK